MGTRLTVVAQLAFAMLTDKNGYNPQECGLVSKDVMPSDTVSPVCSPTTRSSPSMKSSYRRSARLLNELSKRRAGSKIAKASRRKNRK